MSDLSSTEEDTNIQTKKKNRTLSISPAANVMRKKPISRLTNKCPSPIKYSDFKKKGKKRKNCIVKKCLSTYFIVAILKMLVGI